MIAGTKGSSPRVRGKLAEHERRVAGLRLIPARAGKTTSNRTGSASPGAHPRACGENLTESLVSSRGFGSSPRVRGKLNEKIGTSVAEGLIPARAGKTSVNVR